MRTTITLDDDVAALIESERARTGESFREAVNRLVRRAATAGARQDVPPAPPLPKLPGRPLLDISDASAVLSSLDDERRRERNLA